MLLRDYTTKELSDRGYKNAVLIGKGAFSEVFRIWDENGECFRTCKVSQICEMAQKEAKMLKQLEHPLFVRYIDDWKGKSKQYLIMEYVCGRNLKELVMRRGKFTQFQAVSIAMEIAQGICYLHERSHPILFRDIKPDNIMVRQDGRVKLVDVGCACLKGENNTLAGSKGYAAPEQFKRGESIGEESDIYALGKLLYYMLTGKETGKQAEKENFYWKGISYGLQCLMKQAMQEKRQLRIPDMRAFLQYLSYYAEKNWLKQMYADIKALFQREELADFYYVENIRRGMDN